MNHRVIIYTIIIYNIYQNTHTHVRIYIYRRGRDKIAILYLFPFKVPTGVRVYLFLINDIINSSLIYYFVSYIEFAYICMHIQRRL